MTSSWPWKYKLKYLGGVPRKLGKSRLICVFECGFHLYSFPRPSVPLLSLPGIKMRGLWAQKPFCDQEDNRTIVSCQDFTVEEA